MAVCDLGDFPQVGAYPVVGRVVHKHRLCVRVGDYRRLDLRRGHSQRYAEVAVDPGIDVNRHRAAHNKRVYRAAVNIPRQDYPVPRLTDRHHHRLYCARRAIYDEYGIFRAESVRRVFLRFLYYGDRVAQVVEGLHGVDVVLHADLAEEIPQRLVSPAALVTGDVELDNAVELILPHRFVKRRPGLVETVFSHFPHLSRCSFR